jgi:hypothetical protein
MYFRTRMYSPALGRFVCRMPWQHEDLAWRMSPYPLDSLGTDWKAIIKTAMWTAAGAYLHDRYSLYDFNEDNPGTRVEPFSCSATLPNGFSWTYPYYNPPANQPPGSSKPPNTTSTGRGFIPIPPYSPPDEGTPCCCTPAATIDRAQRVDPGASNSILSMKLDLDIEGCKKDVRIDWWTCWRPFVSGGMADDIAGAMSGQGEGGYVPECGSDLTCVIRIRSAPLGLDSGPHLTQTIINYLSCENKVWTKKKKTLGQTYTYSGWIGGFTIAQ